MDIILFALYILIGIILVWIFCRISDIEIQDTADFGLCVVLIWLWPAVIICGIILIIMDWFDGFSGGPGLFS